MRIVRLTCLAALALCGLFAAAGESVAKNQALLIGVSTYTGGAHKVLPDLPGTRNDVTQFWRYLTTSGFAREDVAVLADGLPRGDAFPEPRAAPTHAAIVGELDRLASARYAPGDVVVFYYSGHGVTMPDDNPADEPDPEAGGRDQVLLPADSGMIEQTTEKVENGLVDDELGRYIKRIRQQGATVWAIIDSCYAGSATRGGDIVKSVDPAVLGLKSKPRPRMAQRGVAAHGPIDSAPDAAIPGQLVGFYAVDEFTEAKVRAFAFARYQEPAIAENGRTEMSVFTHFLLQALNQGGPNNFRDLFQDVLAAMILDPENADTGKPTADGNLDLAIPGRGAADASRVRALLTGKTITIQAGELQGFTEGAGVTLFDSGKGHKALAKARISSATAISSKADKIVWMKGVARRKSASLPVQVTEPVASPTYKVALPDRAAGPAAKRVSGRLDAAFQSREALATYGVSLVAANDRNANLVIKVEDGRIWLMRPGQVFIKDDKAFGATLSIGLDEPPEKLRDAIWRLARADKLLRVTTAISRDEDEEPDIALTTSRLRTDRLAAKGDAACAKRGPLSLAEVSALSDVTRGPMINAGNCDLFRVSLVNSSSDTSYYVAAYYIDAYGGVTALGSGSHDRIGCGYDLTEEAEKPLTFDFEVATWDADKNRPEPVGAEHVVVLAVERDASRAMPAFCSLEQKSLSETLTTRGPKSSVQTLFDGITGGTRGLDATALRSQAFRLDLNVVP